MASEWTESSGISEHLPVFVRDFRTLFTSKGIADTYMLMPHEAVTKLSEFIRSLMLKRGITVRELSSKTGLSIGTISDLRNGRDMKVGYYFIVCRALGVEPEIIFADLNDPYTKLLISASRKLNRSQLVKLIDFLESL